jgi:predicted aminopeptidase
MMQVVFVGTESAVTEAYATISHDNVVQEWIRDPANQTRWQAIKAAYNVRHTKCLIPNEPARC